MNPNQPLPTQDDLEFTVRDAREGVGVGLVPTARAERLVPRPFRLAGADEPLTGLVALGLRGDLLLGGKHLQSVIVASISLLIEPPDGSGDFNSYMVWHATNSPDLAREFNRRGLPSQHVAQLRFVHEPGGPAAAFGLHMPEPAEPTFSITGQVREPAEPFTLSANSWVQTHRGSVKISSAVRSGLFGPASLSLNTPAGSALGLLLGGPALELGLLQRFNHLREVATRVALVETAPDGQSPLPQESTR